MKKLLPYLRPDLRESIVGPLLKLAEAGLDLLVPLLVASLIDVGVAGGDRAYILRMALLMAGLGALGLLFSVTAQYFCAKAAVGFTSRVRSALFSHIQTLSHAELDRLGASTLLNRMTGDLNQVQTGLNLSLRLLLRSPFVVFGSMILAFTVNARAAVWFAVVIPVLFAVVFAVMLTCIPLYRKVQQRLDALTRAVGENLHGVRVLRAFGLERQEADGFSEKADAHERSQVFVGRISALLNPVTYVIVNLAVVAVLRTGAVRVDLGEATQGEVIALYNYMAQILVELVKLANLILNITRSLACAGRVSAVLDVRSSLPAGTACPDWEGSAPALELENVSFRYPDAQAESLQEITLSLPQGKTLGVIGGTGSGKSTLAALVPRFYDAVSGTVRVFGQDVSACDPESLRSGLGIVPQRAQLFAGTVRENLLWGNAGASDEELWQALEAAQAAQFVSEKESGLDHRLEAGGGNLSGGQRQRLTIARALVRRPKLLILDDSASALDFATEAALRAALRALPWKPAVLLISQRTGSMQQADAILVLEDGRMAGYGTHEELLKTSPVYREIHDSQFRKEAGR